MVIADFQHKPVLQRLVGGGKNFGVLLPGRGTGKYFERWRRARYQRKVFKAALFDIRLRFDPFGRGVFAKTFQIGVQFDVRSQKFGFKPRTQSGITGGLPQALKRFSVQSP